MKPESPTIVAHRLGLKRNSAGRQMWTWDECLTAAVEAYWRKRTSKPVETTRGVA